MYLSQCEQEELVTINEICEQFKMPRNHLVKVVNKLVKLGWVEATRGRNGGLRMAVQPDELGLGRIIRELEDKGELVDCERKHCTLTGLCTLKGFLDQGLEQFYQLMDQHTLADTARGPAEKILSQMVASQRIN